MKLTPEELQALVYAGSSCAPVPQVWFYVRFLVALAGAGIHSVMITSLGALDPASGINGAFLLSVTAFSLLTTAVFYLASYSKRLYFVELSILCLTFEFINLIYTYAHWTFILGLFWMFLSISLHLAVATMLALNLRFFRQHF